MPDRLYVPGRRSRGGKMSDDRAAWVKVVFADGNIYIKQWSDEEKELGIPEYGPNVVFMLTSNRGQRLTFDVTSLTLAELEALKNFFGLMWELAEPIIRRRDEVAKDEQEKGNDAFVRIYRAVPQLVIRDRIVEAHKQGILNGFEDATGADERTGDSSTTARDSGPSLAEQVSEDRSSQDDSAEAD